MGDGEELFEDAPEFGGPDGELETVAAGDGWGGKRRRRIDNEDRHTYQVLRAHFRTQCQARREICWLCGGFIDYSLPYGHGMAWELDHFVPVSDPVDGERLALVTSNFRASHAVHNRQRGAGTFVATGDDVGGTAVKVFTRPDGSQFDYEYSTDLWDPADGGPSEPW